MLKQLLVLMSLVFVLSNQAIAADKVKLSPAENAIEVTIDGGHFTTLHTAKTQPKPYFFPVRAADGISIVRPLEKPVDHPHHKGMWCSIDEVNEIKFWAEKGKIENAKVEIVTAEGNPARMKLTNHWLDSANEPVLIETVNVSIFANRLVIYDLEFTAGKSNVTFGDTKEGMFGIRVADTLRGQQGGTIANADGKQGEPECWGQPSKWVDYHGMVEGKVKGVAIFDHPLNFRPSRFHVRNYGLFTVSPFGQNAYTNGKLPADPYQLPAGKSVRLRYGLFVHDGDTAAGGVAAAYTQFEKSFESK